jgi:hypothetical protein
MGSTAGLARVICGNAWPGTGLSRSTMTLLRSLRT